jgi:hypothetical protein
MALVTVENQQATQMNYLATEEHGSGTAQTIATGGARVDPLPFPFDWVVLGVNGSATDAKQLPMHPDDWDHKQVPWLPHRPGELWNMLVQAGKVTLAFAAQTGVRDSKELFGLGIY